MTLSAPGGAEFNDFGLTSDAATMPRASSSHESTHQSANRQFEADYLAHLLEDGHHRFG